MWFEFLERCEFLTVTPLDPSNLVTQATSSSAITLTWTDNATDETGYEIQRGSFWWGSYATVATIGADSTSWTDTGLNPGDGYHYRIRAISADGASNWVEGGNNIATTPFNRPLSTVFHTSTMQGNSGSNLYNYIDGVAVWGPAWFKYSSFDFSSFNATTFSASLQGDAPDATLEIWIDNPTSGTKIGTLNIVPPGNFNTLVANSTSISHVTGVHDVYLVYQSPSWHDTNFRSFSFAPNVAPVNTVPGGQIVTRGNTLVFSTANGNAITVNDPDNDGNIIRMSLSVSSGKISLASLTNVTLLSGTGTNDTSVTFECFQWALNDALANLTYTPDNTFTGVAQLTVTSNDLGFTGGGGALTDTDTIAINVTTALPPPAAPTNTHASATSGTGIHLTWSDNSTNETSFEIQRATLNGTFTTIASVGANTTSWNDTGLTAGTTYRYRVRALNANGASNWSGSGFDMATTAYTHPLADRFQANSYQDSNGTFAAYSNGVAMYTDGAWLKYSSFNFTSATTLFSFAYETPVDGNAFELHADSPTGALLGSITITSSGGYGKFATATASLAGITGTHDLYFVYRNNVSWSCNFLTFSFGPNTPPTATVPGSQIILHDTPLTFSASDGNLLSVDDTDNDFHGVKITLSALHGKLTLASTAGLTFSSGTGTNDTSMTFTSQVWQINNDLAGLVYTPDPGFTGTDTLSLLINDLGFTGYGGPLTDLKTVDISVRNSLVIPNAPTHAVANATSSSTIHLAWTDNSVDDTGFEIQRCPVGQNTWTTLAFTAPHTDTYDDTGLASGAGYLYRVRSRNDSGFSAWADSGQMVATTRTSHDPRRSFLARDFQSQSGGVVNSGWDLWSITSNSWISFSDFDFSQSVGGLTVIAGTSNAGLTIEVRLDDPTGALLGQITLANTGGTSHLKSFSTALAQAAGIHDVYFVFKNSLAADVLNTLSFATNHAPVNDVPGRQITQRSTALEFSDTFGNSIQVTDDDNPTLPERITLTALHGTINLKQTTGLTFTTGDGRNNATMTFTGTLADINAALAGLTFTPTAGFSGSASLTITSNDLGNAGFGGPLSDTDTIPIAVSSLDTAPIVLIPAHTIGPRVGMNTAPLEVVATDDGGEQFLTYTWSCLSAPSAASVAFSTNASHAASQTLATFSAPGTYVLSVSISDGHNITTSTMVVDYAPGDGSVLPTIPQGPTPGPTPPPPSPTRPGDVGPHTPPPPSAPGPRILPQTPSQFSAAVSNVPAGGGSAGASSTPAPASALSGTPANNTAAAPVASAATPAAPLTSSSLSPSGIVATPQAPQPAAPAPASQPAAPAPHASIYQIVDTPITVAIPVAEAQAESQQAAVEKQVQTHKVVSRVVGTIASVSGAASVGYLIWVARGGSLLLSMLTSVPMWRFLDPLPVLNSVEPSKRRSWWKWRKKSPQPITDQADDTLEHLTD